jgi:hypothetical protein
VRSSADSNAEGERGIWTFVLTDNGFVTYAKRRSKPPPLSAIAHIYGWSKKGKGGGGGFEKSKATYGKFVKLAEGLQPIIVLRIHARTTGRRCRGCRSPGARWELIRDGAGQYVLVEFLDLMVHHGLKRVARDEAQCRPTDLGEERFVRRGLHLDA